MTPYLLGMAFVLLVLVVIFLRLRNARMKERYASWWIIIAFFTAVFSAVPGLFRYLAGLANVEVSLNLAFFLSGVVLLLITLQHSVDLSKGDEERRRLAEEHALLCRRVEELESRLDAGRPPSPSASSPEE